MAARISQWTLDVRDVARMAQFWAASRWLTSRPIRCPGSGPCVWLFRRPRRS